MISTTPDNLAARWARAGVMFGATPSATPPDLERLLLDTARQMADNPRLLVMSASWLAKHGDRIDSQRLLDLVRRDLESLYQPAMGLMLASADQLAGGRRFAEAAAACAPATTPGPLFLIEHRNDALRRLAERRASALSRAWGVWAPDVEPKYTAIRPRAWIDAHNPSYPLVPAVPAAPASR
jgi:hypothetical protein